MPRICTVCRHPKRLEIEKALRDHVPLRVIATRNGTSTGTLRRHQSHMIAGYAALLPARKVPIPLPDLQEVQQAAYSAIAEVMELKKRGLVALNRAEEAANPTAAVIWFREVRQVLELLCKIELARPPEVPKVDILNSPEWLAIQDALAVVLQPFSEARVKAAEVMAALEDHHAGG